MFAWPISKILASYLDKTPVKVEVNPGLS